LAQFESLELVGEYFFSGTSIPRGKM